MTKKIDAPMMSCIPLELSRGETVQTIWAMLENCECEELKQCILYLAGVTTKDLTANKLEKILNKIQHIVRSYENENRRQSNS